MDGDRGEDVEGAWGCCAFVFPRSSVCHFASLLPRIISPSFFLLLRPLLLRAFSRHKRDTSALLLIITESSPNHHPITQGHKHYDFTRYRRFQALFRGDAAGGAVQRKLADQARGAHRILAPRSILRLPVKSRPETAKD